MNTGHYVAIGLAVAVIVVLILLWFFLWRKKPASGNTQAAPQVPSTPSKPAVPAPNLPAEPKKSELPKLSLKDLLNEENKFNNYIRDLDKVIKEIEALGGNESLLNEANKRKEDAKNHIAAIDKHQADLEQAGSIQNKIPAFPAEKDFSKLNKAELNKELDIYNQYISKLNELLGVINKEIANNKLLESVKKQVEELSKKANDKIVEINKYLANIDLQEKIEAYKNKLPKPPARKNYRDLEEEALNNETKVWNEYIQALDKAKAEISKLGVNDTKDLIATIDKLKANAQSVLSEIQDALADLKSNRNLVSTLLGQLPVITDINSIPGKTLEQLREVLKVEKENSGKISNIISQANGITPKSLVTDLLNQAGERSNQNVAVIEAINKRIAELEKVAKQEVEVKELVELGTKLPAYPADADLSKLDLKGLQAEIKKYQDYIASVEKAKDAIEKHQNQTAKDGLLSDAYNKKVEELNKQAEELIVKANERIKVIEQHIEALEIKNRIPKQPTDLDPSKLNKDEVVDYKKKVQDYLDALNNLKKEIEKNNNPLVDKIEEELNKLIETAKKEMGTVDQRVNELNKADADKVEFDAYKAKVPAYPVEKDVTKLNIAQLNKELETFNNFIKGLNDLTKEVNGKIANNASLKAVVDEITKLIEKANAYIAKVNAQIQLLQNEAKKAEETVKDIQTKLPGKPAVKEWSKVSTEEVNTGIKQWTEYKEQLNNALNNLSQVPNNELTKDKIEAAKKDIIDRIAEADKVLKDIEADKDFDKKQVDTLKGKIPAAPAAQDYNKLSVDQNRAEVKKWEDYLTKLNDLLKEIVAVEKNNSQIGDLKKQVEELIAAAKKQIETINKVIETQTKEAEVDANVTNIKGKLPKFPEVKDVKKLTIEQLKAEIKIFTDYKAVVDGIAAEIKKLGEHSKYATLSQEVQELINKAVAELEKLNAELKVKEAAKAEDDRQTAEVETFNKKLPAMPADKDYTKLTVDQLEAEQKVWEEYIKNITATQTEISKITNNPKLQNILNTIKANITKANSVITTIKAQVVAKTVYAIQVLDTAGKDQSTYSWTEVADHTKLTAAHNVTVKLTKNGKPAGGTVKLTVKDPKVANVKADSKVYEVYEVTIPEAQAASGKTVQIHPKYVGSTDINAEWIK